MEEKPIRKRNEEGRRRRRRKLLGLKIEESQKKRKE